MSGDRPVYAPGDWVTITNFGANVLSIYPATGGTIENGATNAPFTFAQNQSAFFQCIDGLNWIAGFLPGTGRGVALGTVTSVAPAAPVEFVVSGSPVTTSGTLTFTKATETANTVWAGPTSGGAAQPTFRALVSADVPALSYVTSIAGMTGDGTVLNSSVSGSPYYV